MRTRTVLPLRVGPLLLALVLTACDGEHAGAGPDAPPLPGLPADVRYAVSYDQTTEVFSQHWPADMVAAGKAGGDERLLQSYERVSETVAFDAAGNMIRSLRYLEGDDKTRLPEAAEREFADEMPSRPTGEDRVVAVEMKDGRLRFIGKSGATVREQAYDPSRYQVPPAYLDSLRALRQARLDSAATNGRAARTLRALRSQGLSLRQMDARHVAVESTSSGMGDRVQRVRQVVNLALGQPVMFAYYRADGKPDKVIRRAFQVVDGLPVEVQNVTLDYGMVNGSWQPAYRTVVTRTNVRAFVR